LRTVAFAFAFATKHQLTLYSLLLHSAQTLHDLVFQLAEAGVAIDDASDGDGDGDGGDVIAPRGFALQNAISLLCEQWWLQRRPQRESVVPQVVVYLLIRSLEDTATSKGR
jgi:hypothetical protein